MPISAKRKLAIGAAGLAVLAGSGGAYAAASGTPSSPPKPADLAAEHNAFLDDVAKRLNVTRDQLDEAIKGAAEARIDAAVAAGRLSKEEGEAAKKRLQNGGPALLAPGKPGGPRGHGFGGPHHGPFDGAADYLGLSEEQLREALRDGRSLADVAKERNTSVDGLKAALKRALTERLDKAVKDGHLTEAQKQEFLERADERIDAVVNGERPERPKFRWR